MSEVTEPGGASSEQTIQDEAKQVYVPGSPCRELCDLIPGLSDSCGLARGSAAGKRQRQCVPAVQLEPVSPSVQSGPPMRLAASNECVSSTVMLTSGWLTAATIASVGSAAGMPFVGLGAGCVYGSLGFMYLVYSMIKGATRYPPHAPPEDSAEGSEYPMPTWLDTRVLNWGVAGCVGVGKSSLMNALRGVSAQEDGCAPVGIGHTTWRPEPYTLTGIGSSGKDDAEVEPVLLWDLPGAGTVDWPYNSYIQQAGLRYFDGVVFVISDAYLETEVDLLRQLREFGVPHFLVRSKIDQDILNNEQDFGASPAETVAEVKRELLTTGCDAEKTFVVSVKRRGQTDSGFDDLLGALSLEWSRQKEELLGLRSATEQAGGWAGWTGTSAASHADPAASAGATADAAEHMANAAATEGSADAESGTTGVGGATSAANAPDALVSVADLAAAGTGDEDASTDVRLTVVAVGSGGISEFSKSLPTDDVSWTLHRLVIGSGPLAIPIWITITCLGDETSGPLRAKITATSAEVLNILRRPRVETTAASAEVFKMLGHAETPIDLTSKEECTVDTVLKAVSSHMLEAGASYPVERFKEGYAKFLRAAEMRRRLRRLRVRTAAFLAFSGALTTGQDKEEEEAVPDCDTPASSAEPFAGSSEQNSSSSLQLERVLAAVAGRAAFNWAILEPTKLELFNAGCGGFEEMKDWFKSDKVLFGIIRVSIGAGVNKHVFIHWIGPEASTVKTGHWNSRVGAAEERIRGFMSINHTITAYYVEDLDLASMMKELRRVTCSVEELNSDFCMEEAHVRQVTADLKRAQWAGSGGEESPKEVTEDEIDLDEDPVKEEDLDICAPDLATALADVRRPDGQWNWVLVKVLD